MIFYSILPMSDNSESLFLPDWFPVNFSDEEKSMMWTWESGHNIVPVTPLSSDINELFSGKGIIDANNYFGRINNSQKKIINGYTYYASINNQNTNSEIDKSYCENLDRKWRNEFLPEIDKDLNLMKNKINHITELEDGKKIVEELLKINQKHWYIHMLVVIPLHHYADKFFNFVKTFNPTINLSDLYNLFQGIDNKTLEIDKNLYNLKLIYNSSDQNIKDEKLLSEVDKFNQLYGYRLVGFDLSDQIWINDRSIILNLIKNLPISVLENKISQINDSDRKFYLKNLVSSVTNKEDESKIHEMYSVLSQIWYLKEDHSFYIDQYSNALISLAFLKLGDILVTKGLIENNSDIFYLSYKSFSNIDENTSGLMSVITENKKQREHYKNLTPPKYLGNLIKENYSIQKEELIEKPKQLKGNAASAGKVTGIAKIIRSFDDWDKLKKDDIMVCVSTNPSWTPLFGIVSGIISENGGTLSHTAIVAREYNIPTVLDVNNATNIINDNDFIEIDGNTGLINFIN